MASSGSFPPSRLLLLYLTCRSMAEAKKIGNTLVDERLVACVNIISRIHSVYRERGRTKSGSEALLLAKVPQKMQNRIVRRIKQLHSYQVPCICFYPASFVNPEYVRWTLGAMRK